MEIAEEIKKYMQDNKISYEEGAKRMGWTRQNLWDKLNNRTEPNLDTMRKIAECFGFRFELIEDDNKKRVELQEVFGAIEQEQISYKTTERILKAMGYSLIAIPPED